MQKFILLVIIFTLNLYSYEEIQELLSFESKKILEYYGKSYPDENSKENIKKIYKLLINLKVSLENINLKKESLDQVKYNEIKKIMLIFRDFYFLILNHNISFLKSEISVMYKDIKDLYNKLCKEKGEIDIENFKNLILEDDGACIYFIYECIDTCTNPPRRYMKKFECNLKEYIFKCECGEK